MTDTPETPIVVNASPVTTQINTGLRDLALVAAAVPALTTLLGKHDVLGLINFAASPDAAPVIAAVVQWGSVLAAGGIIVWRQLHARWARAEKVLLAKIVPDSVAVVKG